MNEQEALLRLQDTEYECMNSTIHYYTDKDIPMLQTAIKALEEIQQYREFKAIFRHTLSDTAVEFLSDKKEFEKWLERGKWISKRADELLRENEQYRALGTVEELQEAREKQIPKKPLGGADIEGNLYKICPYCSAIVEDGEWRATYCPDCGQKLDWNTETET